MDLQVLEHTEGDWKIEFSDNGGGLRIATTHTSNGDKKELEFNLSKEDVKMLIAFIEIRKII